MLTHPPPTPLKKYIEKSHAHTSRTHSLDLFLRSVRLHVADCYLSVPLTHSLLSRDFVKIQYVRSVA